MSHPFFMHIHIHSHTQRCTTRGWTPTERGERMAESTGSERTCGVASWIIIE
ncbi:LOW QUALITY PROTEIN: hypothetical protein CFOL_v3_30954, partial [Cephalotus follicularis]